jgi:hypothetical protein
MSDSDIPDNSKTAPDYASLHPGYNTPITPTRPYSAVP